MTRRRRRTRTTMRQKTEHPILPELAELNHDMHEGVQLIPWKRYDTIWGRLRAPLHIGSRVWWYFRADAKLCRKDKRPPRDYASYSGILIPQPGARRTSLTGEMEPDDVVVIHDYRSDDKFPTTQYVTLIRLLLTPNLVEVFSKERDIIGINSH